MIMSSVSASLSYNVTSVMKAAKSHYAQREFRTIRNSVSCRTSPSTTHFSTAMVDVFDRLQRWSWHQSHDGATVLLLVPSEIAEEDLSVRKLATPLKIIDPDTRSFWMNAI